MVNLNLLYSQSWLTMWRVMKNQFTIINYEACAGLGVIFPAKSFIYEGESCVFIISPSRFSEKMIKSLSSLKKQLIFISPNNFHNLHLKTMKEIFPDAKFFGPKRSSKQSGVELLKMEEFQYDEMISIKIEGNKALSESLFFIPSEKVLIATDLFFNMYHKMNIATSLAMIFAGTFKKLGTSRMIKLSTKDKSAFKESCLKTFEYPFEKVIPSHGDALSREEFKDYLDELF